MKSVKYFFLLAAIFSAVGRISADLYLPSLPAIADSLHTTISLSQFSITTFLLGFILARFSLAIISDAVGRKIPLIIGLVICLAGCLLCLFADNIYMFLIGRFLQGYGGGGSNVLGRLILRDQVADIKLAKYTSYFSMINISLMATAPLLGGYLQHYFDWQASFIILAGYTVFALIIGIFFLPETNVHRQRDSLRPTIITTNLKTIFANKKFIIYILLLMLSSGSMVAWLTSGPVVLQKVLLLNPIEYGWCAGLVGFCYFIGAYLNSQLVGKFGIQKMLQFGIGSLFTSGIIMLIPIVGFHYLNTAVFVIPMMLATFGISLIIPNSYAAGLTPFAKIAGIAVAIMASIQTLGGAISSSIISAAPDRSQLPVALTISVCGLICIWLIKILKNQWTT